MATMEVDGTLEQALANAAVGLIKDCPAKELHVNVKYYNGFEEVIWFKSNASAVIFSNAIKAVNQARQLKLGESYSD